MNKQELVNKWDKLPIKRDLVGSAALEAVKKDGLALRLVNNQTEEICLAAVKQNGLALRYVKNQTEEICLAAVIQDGEALRYVNESIINKWRQEYSCAGKLVEIDGKKYKLTEV